MFNSREIPPGYKLKGCNANSCDCNGQCMKLVPDPNYRGVTVNVVQPEIDYEKLAKEIRRQQKLEEQPKTGEPGVKTRGGGNIVDVDLTKPGGAIYDCTDSGGSLMGDPELIREYYNKKNMDDMNPYRTLQ